jgi:hypothetical protein
MTEECGMKLAYIDRLRSCARPLMVTPAVGSGPFDPSNPVAAAGQGGIESFVPSLP